MLGFWSTTSPSLSRVRDGSLDVHPRVAMAILRHSQIAVTMDIYSQVSSASTREALKRLGHQLEEGSA